ncbi:MAG TPA: serine/threonine-protein kinase, partial [Polyangiaceae bacterium LLY-WYZ-15_(1-7)]|nr:serine/threonine-protein kinase [Polyangiaceae bacterium LLY-WYZ-15_(1-7)]
VVEALLGYGGMGEVYRARHEVLDRDVAIKVLRPFLAGDAAAAARFRDEVKAVAKLGAHPNVVAAMHASEREGRLYLVMEHVPGGDLRRLVAAEGPLPPERARRYVRQAAAGLAHAHAAGLVHRDVKPSNLLLGEDDVVKVVDLGLSRLAMSEARPRWADELVGSLDYMAPEQADDPEKADARSDLYALGCTLHFLLAGRPPFADRLMLKKLMAHATQAPEPIPGLPAGLQRVLDKLLAKAPADRYQSAAELVDALDALDSDWSVSSAEQARADATSDNERAARLSKMPVNGAPSRDAGWAPKLAWLFGLGLAAALIGLVVLWQRGAPEPAPPPTEGDAGAPAPPPVPTLGLGTPVEGALAEGDELLPKTGSWLDAYRVPVEAGVSYVATLRSREVDPHLVVRSARGWEIASSDDAPGLGSTAQVVWRAEADGEVEVVAACTREARPGSYLLDVARLEARELVAGEVLEGELGAASGRFYGDDTPMDRWWLAATLGETYVVEMRSEAFSPAVFVLSDDGGILTRGEALGEGGSRVVFTAEQTGFVFVAANVAREGEGAYTIELGTELAGELLFDETGMLAEGDARAGDESWYDPYPLEVVAGRTYVITMRSDDFDTYILLVDADGKRLARNDDAIGTDSRLVYTADATRPLQVFANSYAAGMTGQYRVTARALPE